MIINQIKSNFEEAKSLLEQFIANEKSWESIEKAGELMAYAIKNNCKIISCGNGGSMSDATHFAEEMLGNFRNKRQSLPAIAISDSSYISCTANDYGFDYVFSRFVEGLGNSGDILFAISTSGNSANILKAAEKAKEKGIKIISLTGKDGGKLAAVSDVEIRVPYNGYSDRIQEVHIKIIHSLIHYIELKLNL
jgi:D-sedoheptulose 7-phosphate isomerase